MNGAKYAGVVRNISIGRVTLTIWAKEYKGSRYYYAEVWVKGSLTKPGRRFTIYLGSNIDVNELAGLLVAKSAELGQAIEWGTAQRAAKAASSVVEEPRDGSDDGEMPHRESDNGEEPWKLWYNTKERIVKAAASVLAEDIPKEIRENVVGTDLRKIFGMLKGVEEKLRAGAVGEALTIIARVKKLLFKVKEALLSLAEDVETAGQIASRVMLKNPYELCAVLP